MVMNHDDVSIELCSMTPLYPRTARVETSSNDLQIDT